VKAAMGGVSAARWQPIAFGDLSLIKHIKRIEPMEYRSARNLLP
jgi:hypothetical protein